MFFRNPSDESFNELKPRLDADFYGEYDIPEPLDQWTLADLERLPATYDEWRGYP